MRSRSDAGARRVDAKRACRLRPRGYDGDLASRRRGRGGRRGRTTRRGPAAPRAVRAPPRGRGRRARARRHAVRREPARRLAPPGVVRAARGSARDARAGARRVRVPPTRTLGAIVFDFDHTLTDFGRNVEWPKARTELVELYAATGIDTDTVVRGRGALSVIAALDAAVAQRHSPEYA